jgi:hypothetical protein
VLRASKGGNYDDEKLNRRRHRRAMLYKHYKGGIYTYIGEATHSETGEHLAVYVNQSGQVWVRPFDMFHGYLEDGQKRFVKIKE